MITEEMRVELFEAAQRRDKASRLVEAVLKRLERINKLIQQDRQSPSCWQISDTVWRSWIAEQQCLRDVLKEAGIDVRSTS